MILRHYQQRAIDQLYDWFRASYIWEVKRGDMIAETGMADGQEEAARPTDSWIAAHGG